MLNPEDLKKKTFTKGFRGYEVEEVDKFLAKLIKEYEYLYLDILEQEGNQQSSSNVAHLKASGGDEAIRAAMRLAPGEAMLLLDEICFNRLCHPVMRSLSYYTNFFDFSILRKLL